MMKVYKVLRTADINDKVIEMYHFVEADNIYEARTIAEGYQGGLQDCPIKEITNASKEDIYWYQMCNKMMDNLNFEDGNNG